MPRHKALHTTLRTTNRLHRRMRIGAAHRKLSRNHKERFFWHRTTLEPHARSGSAATAKRCSPGEPTFGTGATMTCGGLKKNQCEYDGGWGIPRPNFGRSGAVQAPSFPGALHDLRGGRTRFLVPSGSRSQRVLSGGVQRKVCLLYTSPSPRDATLSRMPSSA